MTPTTIFRRRTSSSSLPAARPPTARRVCPAGCGCRLRRGSAPAASTWRSVRRWRPRRTAGGTDRRPGSAGQDGPTAPLRRPARPEAGRGGRRADQRAAAIPARTERLPAHGVCRSPHTACADYNDRSRTRRVRTTFSAGGADCRKEAAGCRRRPAPACRASRAAICGIVAVEPAKCRPSAAIGGESGRHRRLSAVSGAVIAPVRRPAAATASLTTIARSMPVRRR